MKWIYLIFCIVISSSLKSQDTTSSAKRKVIHVIPESYSNTFSLNIKPLLVINPGDIISTETIDASGHDKNGNRVQHGSNPLTGPFYIEGAKEGDIVAVTLNKLSFNRSWAFTTETFVARSFPDSTLKPIKKIRFVKWGLDTVNGFAALLKDTVYEHLKNFKVPLNPFVGCIGVAPANKKNEIESFFSGDFGGNLDYNRIKEGSTIYLPVLHDGAFLYIGDTHACQGDGEIAGNALETSMNVTFSVRLIKGDSRNIPFPRVEDATYIMSIGLNKSLDNAIKAANSALLAWLIADYHLSLQEATQVISTSVEYTIAEIADPEVEVVAKIKKETLKGLTKYN